jgi:hypothetical protein
MLKSRSHSYHLLWLTLILLLASATRLHELEVRSLWEDEGWTLLLAKGPTVPDIVTCLANDQHPPLFFILFHFWRDLGGSSEFAMRFLSVLTGLIAVAGIYQLGRVMFNRTAGLCAAFLLALSDHHIDLSQDVRHYAQMATLVILASWFYFRLIRLDKPAWGVRIGYILLAAAGLYTHYLVGFVLLIQAGHMMIFVRPWKRLLWTVGTYGAGCALFLPWLPIVIKQNEIRWQTPLYYLNALPNSPQTVRMVRSALLGQQYALMAVLLLLGVVYLTYPTGKLHLRWRPLSPVVFALVWLVGYTAFTFYLNERRQFLTVRNFLLVTPAVMILAGHGLSNLQRELRTFLLIVWLVVGLTTVDTRQLKAPWREVVQNVTDFHNPGEPVIMDIWVGDFPARYYIEQQMGADTPWLSIRETADEQKALFLPYILGYIQDVEAFWLIYWGDDPSPLGYEAIFAQAGFQRTASPYVLHTDARLYAHRYDKLTPEVVTRYRDQEGDIFALQKSAVHGQVARGKTITVTLWWTAERRPPADYSVSVFVLDSTGVLKAQHDGPPLNGEAQTSTWPIDRLQYDQHDLTLPSDLPAGHYQIAVKVYFYQAPDAPLLTPCAGAVDSGETSASTEALCEWYVIGEFSLS